MAADAAPTPTPPPPPTTTTSTRRPFRVGKNHVGGFLVLLAILDLIVLALAAYVLDKLIDGSFIRQNNATSIFATISLLASMLTAAAIISGLLHFKHHNSGSVSSASTTALIAWVVTLLAFGLACKQADSGYDEGSKLKALEAFVIILAFFETLYVLMLHAGLFNSKYGVGYH